jgi:hypothetical protein
MRELTSLHEPLLEQENNTQYDTNISPRTNSTIVEIPQNQRRQFLPFIPLILIGHYATFNTLLALRKVNLDFNNAVDNEFIKKLIARLLLDDKRFFIHLTKKQSRRTPFHRYSVDVVENIVQLPSISSVSQAILPNTFQAMRAVLTILNDPKSEEFKKIKEIVTNHNDRTTLAIKSSEFNISNISIAPSPSVYLYFLFLLVAMIACLATTLLKNSRAEMTGRGDVAFCDDTSLDMSPVLSCDAFKNISSNVVQNWLAAMTASACGSYTCNDAQSYTQGILSSSIELCNSTTTYCSSFYQTFHSSFIYPENWECTMSLHCLANPTSWDQFKSVFGCILAPIFFVIACSAERDIHTHLKFSTLLRHNQREMPEELLLRIHGFFNPSQTIAAAQSDTTIIRIPASTCL